MATTLIANTPLVVAGIRYEVGDKFVNPNDSEAAVQVSAGFAHVPSGTPEGQGLSISSAQATETNELVGSKDPDTPSWAKDISPQDYLAQFPNGPAAALAAEVIAEQAVGFQGTPAF